MVDFDLNDSPAMERVIEEQKPTHVINCAAYGVAPGNEDAGAAYLANVSAPVLLYEICADLGVARFVQIGSCAEYGQRRGRIQESSPLEPVGLYATTKAAASLLLLERAKATSLDLLILRLFNTWGRYEPPHRLIPSMRRSAAKAQTIKMTEGTQVRDFSHVAQSVRAIADLTLAADTLPHSVFNIGTGEGISVREFAERVAEELSISQQMDFGAMPMRPNELPEQIADISRLRKVLGENVPEPINSAQIQHYLQSFTNLD